MCADGGDGDRLAVKYGVTECSSVVCFDGNEFQACNTQCSRWLKAVVLRSALYMLKQSTVNGPWAWQALTGSCKQAQTEAVIHNMLWHKYCRWTMTKAFVH